ncbi:MAG TPA: hypothetical protein VFR37_02380 [Longimicrobium sp.]|nr:hypothetical protein [Longimicrobium sp.]
MHGLLLLTVVCVSYACFSPPPEDGGTELWVENQGETAVLFTAFELEQSHLVDPAPTMQVEEHPDRLLQPGERRRVEVEGYARGTGVRLFLYDVPAGQRSGTVPQSRMITLSDEELRGAGFVIRIPPPAAAAPPSADG